MSHRELCLIVAKYFLSQPWCDIAGWELRYNRGFADVLAVGKDKVPLKICVAEVKRTRGDLLADLNVGKLLRYERGTTHCYLAATPEALRLGKLTEDEVINDLTKLGLPQSWGILVIENDKVRSIRSVTRIDPGNRIRLRSLIRKLARSNMYRSLQIEIIDDED